MLAAAAAAFAFLLDLPTVVLDNVPLATGEVAGFDSIGELCRAGASREISTSSVLNVRTATGSSGACSWVEAAAAETKRSWRKASLMVM
jgi:hypothetical protein